MGTELFIDAGLEVLRRPRTGHEGRAADVRTAQALPTCDVNTTTDQAVEGETLTLTRQPDALPSGHQTILAPAISGTLCFVIRKAPQPHGL
jgi:hypothetical protein